MGIPVLIRTQTLSPFSLISIHNYTVLSLLAKKNNILQKDLLCIRHANNPWKDQLLNLYCLPFSPPKEKTLTSLSPSLCFGFLEE